MPTNEGDASSDASEEGTLTDSSSACELHTAQGARQDSLVVAEVGDVGRISLRAQQQVARAAQQCTKSAPLLLVVHVNR